MSLSSEIYAAVVAAVDLFKGQGMRWQLYVDPLIEAEAAGPSVAELIGFAEPDKLFDVDFTVYTLGPRTQAEFLAETAVNNPGGLTFARASVATVQTDAVTIDSTPAVDEACIGCLTDDQDKRGLVMQPRTALCLSGLVFPRTHTGWSAGETTGTNGWGGLSSQQTNNDAVSPDGQTKAIRLQTFIGNRGPPAYAGQDDGAYAIYAATAGVTAPATFSMWVKGAAQMVTFPGGNPSPPTAVVNSSALRVPDTGAWNRAAMTGITIRQYTVATDGRDFSACSDAPYIPSGGLTAYDCHVDFINVTRGKYTPEAIELTGGVCASHYLSYSVGTELLAPNGQIRIYASFSPMHASTDDVYWGQNNGNIATGLSLFAYQTTGPVNSYAYVRQSDHRLVVKIGAMADVVSTNAMVFAANDTVELVVFVGSGIASVARYRVNGGAPIDLVLATVANAPAPDAFYFHSAPFDGSDPLDRYGWPCRVHHLTAYSS